MDIMKIVEAGAIVILGGWNGYQAWNSRRMKKMEDKADLKPNPLRCQEHADAINEMRDDIHRIKEHLGIV